MVPSVARVLGVSLSVDDPRVTSAAAPRRWRLRWSRVWLCAAACTLDLTLWGGDGSARWGADVPTWAVVVSAVALFVVLLDDRRVLPLGFGLAWCYSLAWGAVLPSYHPFTAMMLGLYEVARRLPARAALPYLVAVAVPLVLNTANVSALTHVDPVGTAVNAALWAVMTALVWMAGRVGYRNAEMIRLREEVFAARMHLARQQDRVALARELHDVLSHTIGAVSMQAAGARALPAGDPRVVTALASITTTSTTAMQELRRLLGFLASPAGDLSTPGGDSPDDVAERLETLVEATRACGLRVRVAGLEEARDLAQQQQHLVVRIVQEALANAQRHQGRGCRVEVHLQSDADTVTAQVDSVGGAGRDAALSGHGSGMGLQGMAERIARVGGDLEADGTASSFRVRARIPR